MQKEFVNMQSYCHICWILAFSPWLLLVLSPTPCIGKKDIFWSAGLPVRHIICWTRSSKQALLWPMHKSFKCVCQHAAILWTICHIRSNDEWICKELVCINLPWSCSRPWAGMFVNAWSASLCAIVCFVWQNLNGCFEWDYDDTITKSGQYCYTDWHVLPHNLECQLDRGWICRDKMSTAITKCDPHPFAFARVSDCWSKLHSSISQAV